MIVAASWARREARSCGEANADGFHRIHRSGRRTFGRASARRQRRIFCAQGKSAESLGAGLDSGQIHGRRQMDGRVGNSPPPDSGLRLVHRKIGSSRRGAWSGRGHRAFQRKFSRPLRTRGVRHRRRSPRRSTRRLQRLVYAAAKVAAVRRFPQSISTCSVESSHAPAFQNLSGRRRGPPARPRRGDSGLAGVEHGGWVIVSSDMFFGSRNNLILPGPSTGMHDGWETRRRRGPGHDWCIVRLGATGKITGVEVDTAYFKGNFPESCSLEICRAPRDLTDPDALGALALKEILPRTRLRADSVHFYEKKLLGGEEATHARFHIYPDGGVARLRLFGILGKQGS